MAALLVFLQIIKVFLDLWKANNDKDAQKQATTAKEIVDAFATADPKNRASELNNVVSNIRLRNK